MILLVISAIVICVLLYLLGRKNIAKKSGQLKKTAKVGGLLAMLFFILRLGPAAVFNLINLIITILPLINKYSFLRENNYNSKQVKNAMTQEEARLILGVSENATAEDIKLAFNKLMKKNHPDVGGTKYLAEQLINARDTLLGSRKK